MGVAALIGGRLYHVIDQWQLYQNDPITAILPIARQADGSYQFAGITGLGVYGGIITGTIAVVASYPPLEAPAVLALGRRHRARRCS